MDSQNFGKVQLSEFGHLVNPIADVHLLKYIDSKLSDTWDSTLKILTNPRIISVINQLTDASNQSLVMSMYFDQNAGTPIHQDCYYLDTLPPRKLTAAWIALEDINEKAGRFCVAPKTQNIFLELDDEEIKNSNLYEQRVDAYINENHIELIAPKLQKGDVLFWNSGTMHGSLKTKDKSFSRKSFTCHFVPSHCEYVQNEYIPKVREMNGFVYNSILCRITNSIKKEKMNNELVPRSADTFLR
jgi:phytanoyl-CoA hydroxylase